MVAKRPSTGRFPAVPADGASVVEALRQRQEQYRFLTETVPVQIWTSLPDGRLDYVSEQTARHLGLSQAQLLADGWQNVVHPDDLPPAIERWTHALASGDTYEVEFRLKLASGEYAWHLARAVPQRTADGAIERWFGTNTNIEEQRAHQRQVQVLLDEVEAQAARLREQNQLLALEADAGAHLTRPLALEATLQGCVELVVKHLDTAFARIWTVDESGATLVLQASAGLYTHKDGVHARVPVGQLKIGRIAAERRPHLTNEVTSDASVGDQAWAAREAMVAFAGYPLILGDKVLGVIATFARHPLSAAALGALGSVAHGIAQAIERHRAEAERASLLAQEVQARHTLTTTLAERERLLAAAEDARERAEMANRAKDEFLATASHELRTPLNAILGWARMLRSGSVEPSAFLRGLETIERNANAQVQLIEDILDGSRVITGKLHLDIRSIDLSAVVQAALDAVRPAAEAKTIVIDVALDPKSARMRGDPDRLQQVVWNLVNNAIKFTPKGGKVWVRVVRTGASTELSVKDNGQGISPEFLPHVFERFRQAEATSVRRHGGLGLGLALVRYLVEAHGGTVRAESAGEGQGAEFILSVPVQDVVPDILAPDRPTPSAEPTAALAAPQRLAGVSVLVIDDEPDARDLVALILRTQGAEVFLASSVDQAMEILGQRTPTLLISDIGMPLADGYSLIRRVREMPSKIPAIALTAYARDEDRRRALAAGFQAYLAKPVEPAQLVRLVRDLTP